MKKSIKIIVAACVALLCFLSVLSLAVYHFFFDISAIKPGEKITDCVSPSGAYTITAYLNDGGATTSFAVLCVLNDGKREKNIYWNDRCDSAEIVWIDDDTVVINGIRLENVKKDTYDFRKEK